MHGHRELATLTLALALATTADAQNDEDLRVHTAESHDIEVASPMVLTLKLPENLPELADAPDYYQCNRGKYCFGGQWHASSMARYVVDKARVHGVSIRRGTTVMKKQAVFVEMPLSSGWFRQDLDITTRLLVDGREVLRHHEDDLTVGNQPWDGRFWGSSSKRLEIEWRVKPGDFEGWFENAAKVELQVQVAVDDD